MGCVCRDMRRRGRMTGRPRGGDRGLANPLARSRMRRESKGPRLNHLQTACLPKPRRLDRLPWPLVVGTFRFEKSQNPLGAIRRPKREFLMLVHRRNSRFPTRC